MGKKTCISDIIAAEPLACTILGYLGEHYWFRGETWQGVWQNLKTLRNGYQFEQADAENNKNFTKARIGLLAVKKLMQAMDEAREEARKNDPTLSPMDWK